MVMVQTKEQTTPFAKTKPKSKPILSLIKPNIKSPTIVVKALDNIGFHALRKALLTASTSVPAVSRS